MSDLLPGCKTENNILIRGEIMMENKEMEIKKMMREYKKEVLAAALVQAYEENKALREKLQGDLELMKSGYLIHTNGTVTSTKVWKDGEPLSHLTTLIANINVKRGVYLSLERAYQTDVDGYPEYEREYPFTDHDNYDRRLQEEGESWIPELDDDIDDRPMVTATRYIPDPPKVKHQDDLLPFEPDLSGEWQCGHCWSPNPTNDKYEQSSRVQCSVCRQWTNKKKTKVR